MDSMAISINLTELKARGWTVLDSDAQESSLLKIGKVLGTPVPPKPGCTLISRLTPTPSSKGKKTFSTVFGKGKFPMHTDTAHWPKPARYIILCDAGKLHDRPTLIVSGNEILNFFDPSDVGNAVWKVSGPSGYFPCSLTFSYDGCMGLRYDPLCMECLNASARSISANIKRIPIIPKEISWKFGKVVIFDNWRVLHGRGDSKINDVEKRVLLRLMVATN